MQPFVRFRKTDRGNHVKRSACFLHWPHSMVGHDFDFHWLLHILLFYEKSMFIGGGGTHREREREVVAGGESIVYRMPDY